MSFTEWLKQTRHLLISSGKTKGERVDLTEIFARNMPAFNNFFSEILKVSGEDLSIECNRENDFIAVVLNVKFWGEQPKFVFTENDLYTLGDYSITEQYKNELKQKWLEFLEEFKDLEK